MTTPDIDLDALTALEKSARRPAFVDAGHIPTIAEMGDGQWGVQCWLCSRIAEDYVWPCREGVDYDVPSELVALSALTATRAELETYKREVGHADAEREEAERHRDAARHAAEYWKGKYEAAAMDQLAAAAQPDETSADREWDAHEAALAAGAGDGEQDTATFGNTWAADSADVRRAEAELEQMMRRRFGPAWRDDPEARDGALPPTASLVGAPLVLPAVHTERLGVPDAE